MRYRFVYLLLFPAALPAIAQTDTGTAVDSVWVKSHYHKQERNIPMRDGVNLFTAIYIPNDGRTKHPILMTRTPYSCAPYGDSAFLPSLWNTYWKEYLRRGYILVIQDVRGRWMSGGEFENIRPYHANGNSVSNRGDHQPQIDEATDAYDAIDWLVKNIPGNNGKVGVFGISYPGFYTTMAALSNHPALKAVSPQAPVTDWYHGDDFHHNGAFFLMDCFSFYTKGFGYPRRSPTSIPPVQALKIPRADNYATFLQIGAIPNFTRLTGDSLAFWKEMIRHPNEDDWWKARNPLNFVRGIRPAVLVVGGFFDAEDCYGALHLYKAIESDNPPGHCNKLVMGPWNHGQWATNDGSRLGHVQFGGNTVLKYQQEIELPFFDRYLLDADGDDKVSGDTLAEATVFFSGENHWRSFPSWPPAESRDRSLYLQPGKRLSWDRPLSRGGSDEYTSDPDHPVPYTDEVHFIRTRDYMTDDQRFASRRPDVLSFQTDTLSADLTVGGPLTADLFVSITGEDADFVVKLIDVFPDGFSYPGYPMPNKTRDAGGPYPLGGYQMLVRGDIIRGRYRNSFERPAPFAPGKIEEVKFQLPDIAHTFLKGHRILVQIQSSWFPLVDRNPQRYVNIYEAKEADFKKITIHVYHNAAHPSGIFLPVVK